MLGADRRTVVRVQQVPDEHLRVVAAGCKHASPRGVPLDAVQVGRVPAELKQRLARLSDVEDADNIRILGKSRKQMRVVWRRRKTE